jgi:hypothetical protein
MHEIRLRAEQSGHPQRGLLLPYLRHGKAISVRWPTALARARKLDRTCPGMGEGEDGISQLWRDSLAF